MGQYGMGALFTAPLFAATAAVVCGVASSLVGLKRSMVLLLVAAPSSTAAVLAVAYLRRDSPVSFVRLAATFLPMLLPLAILGLNACLPGRRRDSRGTHPLSNQP